MLGSRSVHGNSRSFASNSRSFASNSKSFASNSRFLEGPFTLGSRSNHASNIGPLTVHMPCVHGGSGPGFPIIK